MKIAILGTRGIPNHYGGYEAFAERFAVMMAERGHEVAVFNSSLHPYGENNYKGVEIIHCDDPEDRMGTAGQFIYDLRCIRVCRKRHFDVILQLGYTSSSVWSFLFPGKSAVITNMDGLEWKREKYSGIVKVFLKRAEKWAAKYSTHLIADNPAIRDYLVKKYGTDATFISYGADVFSSPDPGAIHPFNVEPYEYNMLIARMEPENNIEMVIKGHLNSQPSNSQRLKQPARMEDSFAGPGPPAPLRRRGEEQPLLIVGGLQNAYAKSLVQKYASENIVFLNSIYDTQLLNQLRYFSNIYFHGHSAGGTNPSLLEAMASSALISSHDNEFNRAVLGGDAFYFKNENDIAALLQRNINKKDFNYMLVHNMRKISENHNWQKIASEYENVLKKYSKHT